MATLRKRLQVEGYLPSSFTRFAGRDSRFDSRLADAVARFQERHGLAVDGGVGPATLTALNVPVERRILQIQANLERYRWLPRDLGERYLVVNIPAFRLDAFEKDERVLSMAVVVGSELDHGATPVFADSIAYVQFAPYWNVPARIAREEILPKAAADPGYLERGPFINDAGNGFLHMAVVVCPGRGFIDNGRVEFSGYCSATDKDGDKAVLKWSCAATNGPCAGAFDFIAGTGKYQGIRGRASFEAVGLGQAATGPVGYANWKGDYELP